MRLPAIALLATISMTAASPMMLLPEVNQGAVGDSGPAVLAMTFGEGAGALDWSGTQPASTITGATYVDAATGYRFDGNDWIKSGNNGDVGNGTYTVACWFKRTGTSGSTQTLIGKMNASSAYPFLLCVETDARVKNVEWNGTTVRKASGPSVTLDVWYHIVVTHDGLNTMRLFVNGSYYDQNSVLSSIDDCSNTDAYTIGARETAASRLYFVGDIDDVVIYTRVLNDADIKQLYQQGKEQKP